MDYQINLLPYDVDSREASKIKIQEQAQDFVENILHRYITDPTRFPFNDKLAILARDMLNTRFWGVLGIVDGQRSDIVFSSKEQATAENIATRAWAQQQFQRHELEDILNIAVNQALLHPRNTGWPGTRRGHSVLYQELVKKEGSIFSGAVTEEFRKRLQNGRFWESLPDVQVGLNEGHGIYVVREVLEHPEDLDITFVLSGLELLKFSLENRSLDNIQLHYVGEKALDNYAAFLLQVDAQGKTVLADMEMLLRPYVSAVLQWDGDREGPYYNGKRDSDHVKVGKFQDKLRAPLLQKYLAESPSVQQHMATILSEGIKYKSGGCFNNDGQYPKFVKEVLEIVPNPKRIMTYLLLNVLSEDAAGFFAAGKKHGHDLSSFMSAP